MQKMYRIQYTSQKKTKSIPKRVEWTNYTKGTKIGLQTSIYKINLFKIVRDRDKS